MIKLEIQPVAREQVPMALLLIADPSEQQINNYLEGGYCFLALVNGETVGAYVLKWVSEHTLELMNIVIAEQYQGQGIGTELLQRVISSARELGAQTLELGTGSFGYQLSYYQRAGFRVVAVDRDFFLENYDEPIFEQGIQHRDMLRLELCL